MLEVWEHYRRTISPKSVLTPKRAQLIRDALKDYSVARLRLCIDGYHRSPHHNGLNDRQTKYLELELFLRDAQHIEAGERMATELPAQAARKRPVLGPCADVDEPYAAEIAAMRAGVH